MSAVITVNGRRVVPVMGGGLTGCNGCVFEDKPMNCLNAVSQHNCSIHSCIFCDEPADQPAQQPQSLAGGKQGAGSYYHVAIDQPMQAGASPYVAECADIIEALNMTFNEGEAFKALWRLAAARQGKTKDGSKGAQYDADKVAHYGARVAAQTRRGAA